MLSFKFWAAWVLTLLLSSSKSFCSYSDTIPNANDQCKILLGEDATFCQVPIRQAIKKSSSNIKDISFDSKNKVSSMCASLYCRKSLADPACIYSGYDAAEGTSCFFGYVSIGKSSNL